MIDYEKICRQTISVAVEAGQLLKKERKSFRPEMVETKGLHDFVSYVDKASERLIVDGLLKMLPDAGFITEEGTVKTEDRHYKWIIDPLDGTTNFIHGISPFAVSIALMEGNDVVIGVVYEVSLDECFYSWKDAPSAYLNGEPIQVSETKSSKDGLIATGFPYYDFSKMSGYIKILEHFMRYSRGVRRLGSAATDLAYVAAGRFDAFYEYSLQPYDVAAGAFIVQKAKGIVTDFHSGTNFIFGKEIIASNFNTSAEIREIITKNFYN